MKSAFAGFLVLHGAIHGMGFMKAFQLGKLNGLTQSISKPAGVVWLLTCVLFMLSAALLFAAPKLWAVAALAALVVSQALIVSAWRDAKWGTLANAVILLPIVVSLARFSPASLPARYAREVAQGSASFRAEPLVREAELTSLPSAVQRYLRYVGVVGKPHVHHVQARFRGEFRNGVDAPFMPFRAEQTNFFEPASRFFLLEAERAGLPFVAYHRFVGKAATMHVKVAGLLSVVDAAGPQMNQSETVTMLNDMCWLAPAALLSPNLRWEELAPQRVKATFRNAGQTVSAELSFNERGELVLFISEDRFESADGKTYERHRWCTPLRDYRDFHGYKLASYGEASWLHPQGAFVYGRFELLDLTSN